MYLSKLPLTSALLAGCAIQTCSAHVAQERSDDAQCTKTNVAILYVMPNFLMLHR